MTVDEDNTTLCDVWRRGELFQTGKLSRWQATDESTVPVKDACENGIANLVRPLIEKAQAMLATH